jgi:hypothetical protein
MTNPIPINLAVEDALSEAIIRQILRESQRDFVVGKCYNRGGYGYLKKTIRGFNNAAKGTPYLVLTDLDKKECPLALIEEWLPQAKHPNLLFRIAVREVESWVLGDRETFAKFLGIKKELIPQEVDDLEDPKKKLIDLARKSKKKVGIVPAKGSTAKIGPDYNGQLIDFVNNYWQVERAALSSPSLQRAYDAILTFEPTWQETK